MKKTLLIACLLLATSSMSFAAENVQGKVPANCQIKQPVQNVQRPPKKPNLEQRLNLTEEQKIKAKANREAGFKEIKPIMDNLKSKKEQKRMLMKNQNPTVKEVEKLEQLNNDINKLEKQAREIRIKNAKQFEAILTPEQKEEFNKMKREGRREFGKRHPHKFPVGGPKGHCPMP